MGFKVNINSLDITRFLPTFSPKLIHWFFNICLIPSNSCFHLYNRPAITGLPGPCILPPPHLIKSFWLALLRVKDWLVFFTLVKRPSIDSQITLHQLTA